MTVSELFEAILPRLDKAPQKAKFTDSVQAVLEIVTRHLWKEGSDLLEYDFSQDVAADGARVYFPRTFLGQVPDSQPWIIYEGQRFELKPLPRGIKGRAALSASARPEFYEVRGNTITLYPATDKALVFWAEIYRKPQAITAFSDELPFGGAFDQLFIDAVLRVGSEGAALVANPTFYAFVVGLVDALANRRPAKRISFRYPA